MGFDDGLAALRTELSLVLKYKAAYDAVMILRAEPAVVDAADQLDETASKLGEAIGVCVAEMYGITGQLQSAYTAAAVAAAQAAAGENYSNEPAVPPGQGQPHGEKKDQTDEQKGEG